jgi:hypothetical protein
MPDGSVVSPVAARQGAGKSLLFPVAPLPGETLLGFVTRCLAKNHLGVPVQFMRRLDIDLSIRGDLLGRLQARLPAIQEALGLSDDELGKLWGAAAVGPERRRRLGGVWLRPSLIEQGTRRVPPSIAADQPDHALWMVRHMTFCPITWEELVGHCPSQWCGKQLTWPRAQVLDRCRHCDARLSEWKARKVPVRDRRVLTWVSALFSDSEVTRQSAVAKVPATFEIETATDVYELLLAFGRAVFLLRLADGDDRDWSFRDLAAAARFMLDYPRSRWDALQTLKLGERPRLYGLLARIARDSPVVLVRRQLEKILLDDGSEIVLRKATREPPPGTLTTTDAALVLRVQKGDVKRLVASDLLHPVRTSGGERQQNLFDERVIRRIRDELDARISWRSFSTHTGLPTLAVEQLLALGHLVPLEHPIGLSLFGERQLERDQADLLIDRLGQLPSPGQSEDWVPLEQAFMGVGGREKPWAPIILDGMLGRLPGELVRWVERGRLTYGIRRTTARALLMGGPEGRAWYQFPRTSYGEFDRDELKPGEVAEYLNCSAVDLSWLIEQRCLLPIPGVEPRRFRRRDVESLGAVWMTAREAAARLGIEGRHLWRTLERHDLTAVIGQGFYLRDHLEAVIKVELSEPILSGIRAGEPQCAAGASWRRQPAM